MTLENVKTEPYKDMEIDSVQVIFVDMDKTTGKPEIFSYWQALGVQTTKGYLYNAYISQSAAAECNNGKCELDDVRRTSISDWNRENILNRYKNEFFFTNIGYSDFSGHTFKANIPHNLILTLLPVLEPLRILEIIMISTKKNMRFFQSTKKNMAELSTASFCNIMMSLIIG